MYDVFSYLQNHNMKYKTLKDGEVILEDTLSFSNDLNKRRC